MTCPYCTRAQTDPHCPLFRADCRGCAVRSLAVGPQFHASGLDGALSAGYRKALSSVAGDGWRELHAEVKAEAARLKAVRRSNCCAGR